MNYAFRAAIFAVALCSGINASAGSGWAGAISGGAQALSDEMDRREEFNRQMQIIQRQHELEMQRIQYEQEMQIKAERERQRAYAEAQWAQQLKERAEKEKAQKDQADREAAAKAQAEKKMAENVTIISAAHKDWLTIINTDAFKSWESKLPPERRDLLQSTDNPQIVIMFLDMYKNTIKPRKK